MFDFYSAMSIKKIETSEILTFISKYSEKIIIIEKKRAHAYF